MKKLHVGHFFGEVLGTFILTFVGCSAVAVAVTTKVFESIFPIATIWGIGVAIAVFATKKYSSAHLNPAVSLGFLVLKQINLVTFLKFCFAQLIGGVLAGVSVFAVFRNKISAYEVVNNIVRGAPQSRTTASIFGEFFPNPGAINLEVSVQQAMFWEGLGTFLLMLGVLLIIRLKVSTLQPILIGVLVAVLIVFLAPYTQCGMNPARDFGPRLVAYLAGWGKTAFPEPSGSFFTVYILSPCVGSAAAAYLLRIAERLVRKT